MKRLPKWLFPKSFAIAGFSAASLMCGSADAQLINYDSLNNSNIRVESDINIGDRPGVDNGDYEVGAFMSLIDDTQSLLFLDGRGNVNLDSGNWSGAIGVGYRQNVGAAVLGANAYYNYREYFNGVTDHNFSTMGFGLEALMSDWAIRSNAYFSLDGSESNGRTAQTTLVQQIGADTGVQNILFSNQMENVDEALDGFDLTLSRKFSEVSSECGAGVYYLTAGDGPDAWGVSGHLESWLTGNLAANLNISHDNFFDTTVYGGLSIYFGGPAIDVAGRSQTVASRLWSRVQRQHVTPVLNYNRALPDQFATDADSGDLVTVAQFNTGDNLASGPGLMEADGDFVDILLVESDSIFAVTTHIALEDDQRLLAASSAHFAATNEFGVIFIPGSGQGGDAPLLLGDAGVNVIELANGNEVNGFDILSGAGGRAIFGMDIDEFTLIDNSIMGDGGILVDAGVSPTLTANLIGNSVTETSGIGVDLLGDDIELLVAGNEFNRNDSANLVVDGFGTVSGFVFDNEFNESATESGFVLLADTASVSVLNNEANANALDGIEIELTGMDTSTVFVAGNDANLNAAGDGISLEHVGTGVLLGSASNNTTLGNAFNGIDIDAEVIGSMMNRFQISGNEAGVDGIITSGNGMTGISVTAPDGIFANVFDNDAHHNMDGIELASANGPIVADLINNRTNLNGFAGLSVLGLPANTDFMGVVANNDSFDNGFFGLRLDDLRHIEADITGNETNLNFTGLFVEAAGNFTGNVGDVADASLGNSSNLNTFRGFLFDITGDFTGDFVNNSALLNTGFDYDTTAGGTVMGVFSPNESTTNTAADFDGNIAAP